MKKKKLLVLINELKNEKEKIIEYIDYHSNPFPEIVKDLQNKHHSLICRFFLSRFKKKFLKIFT